MLAQTRFPCQLGRQSPCTHALRDDGGLETKHLRQGAKIATADGLVQLLLATEKILDY